MRFWKLGRSSLLCSYLLYAVSLLAIYFAVHRWLWYQSLPRRADARICGNCFLGSVGVPIELGLLGGVFILQRLLGIRSDGSAAWWLIAAFGVCTSPLISGVPIFAIAFLGLAAPIAKALLFRTARMALRVVGHSL